MDDFENKHPVGIGLKRTLSNYEREKAIFDGVVQRKKEAAEARVFEALWELAKKHRLEAITKAGTRFAVTGDIVREMAAAAVVASDFPKSDQKQGAPMPAQETITFDVRLVAGLEAVIAEREKRVAELEKALGGLIAALGAPDCREIGDAAEAAVNRAIDVLAN